MSTHSTRDPAPGNRSSASRWSRALLWLLMACSSGALRDTRGGAEDHVVGGRWTQGDPRGTLSDPHILGAATLLADGRVLVAGGLNRSAGGLLATRAAELYDPREERWSATGELRVSRWSLDAVTLKNGQALFAGGAIGFNTVPALDSAELFDPERGQFSLIPSRLSVGRHAFGITLLKSGEVLITGGNVAGNRLDGSGVTAVDLYDPERNEFRPVASLHEGRSLHAQVTLRDGRVLVIGGARTTCEIYDPDLDQWRVLAGRLPTTLKDMKAFELFDGRVFIAAGQNTGDGVTTDATWYLDLQTGQLSEGPSMKGRNYSESGPQIGVSDYSAFDLFPEGHALRGRYLLFAGGEHDPREGPDVELHSASLFDVAHARFVDVGPMPYIHDDHTESLLQPGVDGHPELLLLGGNRSSGTSRFALDLNSLDLNSLPKVPSNPRD